MEANHSVSPDACLKTKGHIHPQSSTVSTYWANGKRRHYFNTISLEKEPHFFWAEARWNRCAAGMRGSEVTAGRAAPADSTRVTQPAKGRKAARRRVGLTCIASSINTTAWLMWRSSAAPAAAKLERMTRCAAQSQQQPAAAAPPRFSSRRDAEVDPSRTRDTGALGSPRDGGSNPR